MHDKALPSIHVVARTLIIDQPLLNMYIIHNVNKESPVPTDIYI